MPISAEMVARSRDVAEPRWSPDGRQLGWVESFAGRADLLMAAADRSDAPRIVTADAPVTPAAAYGGGAWCWVGDDRVAVTTAEGGLAIVALDGGAPTVVSAEGRASAPAATPDGAHLAFVLERDDACDVVVAPADGSGVPVAVSSADYAWDPALSPDGTRVAWHEWDLTGMSWDASRIVVAAIDGSDATVIAGGDAIAVGQPRFSPDGGSLAYVSDESGWWNVWVTDVVQGTRRPALAEAYEHAEPSWGPGQRSFAWAPDGRSIAINRNEDGFGRLVVVDRSPVEVSPAEVSRGWHHGLDWGSAGIVCVRSGARTPSTVTVLSPDGATRVAIARGPVGRFEESGLVEPEAVTWPGADGKPVHGLLYRPVSEQLARDGLAPMLVDVHGGPTGQATASWSARVQYFVSRGWSVLAPDYRGSTGYGRGYAQALAGGWGDLDVADTAAGIRAAGEKRWCDPRRVAAMGGSAGGLTVLLLCARHGDLVRAGISLYGVTDLFELARTTHRFESSYLDRVVGVLPDDSDRYRDRSPVSHAADIRVPLLLLQGDADRVVPPEQARALVDAVRAAGGTVEHQVYEREGHGWERPETVADALTRTESFLERWVLAEGGVLAP